MKRTIILASCIICLILGGVFYWHTNQTIVLHIGLFSGSNWNVPDANSYTLIDEAIAQFEEAHPNVEIVYESGIRKSDYEEWLSQEIIKDDMPDVYFVPSEMFSTLAKNGSLKKLNTHISEDDDFTTSVYYEKSLEAGIWKEDMYALPYESVPNLMFVNKTLLKQEGIEMPRDHWTWEDFYEICKKVSKDTNQDGTMDQFGYYGYTWEQAAYSNGAILYDELSNRIQLDQESVMDAIAFMRRLSALQDEKVTSEMFDQGQVAFCPMNYSDYRTYMPYPWRVKKYSNFEWDSIPLPSGPKGGNTSQIDTLMVGMSSRTKHAQLAWEFMKLLSSDADYQRQLVKHSQGVSVLKDVMQAEDVMEALKEDNPGDSQFKLTALDDVMNHGVAIRKTETYEQIMQTADASINTLLQNDQDIENALILLQRQINTLLSR